MNNQSSRAKTWEKIRAINALKKNHDHADEHKHTELFNDNDRVNTLPSDGNIHAHDADQEETLKARMRQIQNFINRDAEAQYALKMYQGLEKGVLVNACKGLGTAQVKETLIRVREKPAERIRKTKGEYLTGALRMEVQAKGIEWGAWKV